MTFGWCFFTDCLVCTCTCEGNVSICEKHVQKFCTENETTCGKEYHECYAKFFQKGIFSLTRRGCGPLSVRRMKQETILECHLQKVPFSKYVFNECYCNTDYCNHNATGTPPKGEEVQLTNVSTATTQGHEVSGITNKTLMPGEKLFYACFTLFESAYFYNTVKMLQLEYRVIHVIGF